jgi:hypothetical protein
MSARGAATTSHLRDAAKRADSLLQEMTERSAKVKGRGTRFSVVLLFMPGLKH